MNTANANASLSREPLEDLMLAMDVVDTLRHSEGLVSRELNSQARRDALIERLRDIYHAQGIVVSDAVLAEGVRALEEERFSYEPPEPSLSVRLAKLYVNRDTWGKPVLLLLGLLLLLAAGYYFLSLRPAIIEREELPRKLEDTFAGIVNLASAEPPVSQAQGLVASAREAIAAGDFATAKARYQDMRDLRRLLESEYRVTIVTDPQENSGVWRVPSVNSKARNYYLIVEAISKGGERQTVTVRNEEDGKEYSVRRWGIRVDEQTFEGVAADKQDDGIIQGNVIGRKERGRLVPQFDIPTSGGAITEW